MTLDELDMIFAAHCLTDRKADRRAGIRAVVTALQDTVVKVVMSANVDLPRHEAVGMVYRQFINEILASDGVQGTHGSPELDEDARKMEAMGQDAGPTVQDLFPEAFAPAAAPDVCEWTRITLSNHYITGHGNRRYWDATCTMECGECHRPIKFKEGSE